MPQIAQVARTKHVNIRIVAHESNKYETPMRFLVFCRVTVLCVHNAVYTFAVVATTPLLHSICTFACISIFTQRLHVIFAFQLPLHRISLYWFAHTLLFCCCCCCCGCCCSCWVHLTCNEAIICCRWAVSEVLLHCAGGVVVIFVALWHDCLIDKRR